jgi:nitrous oxide reductase accessory protein NosL
MKLIFKPYTNKEIERLLSTDIGDTVTDIKVQNWMNIKTADIFYGLEITVKGGVTMGLCEGNRAVVFEDKKTANKVCKDIIDKMSVLNEN